VRIGASFWFAVNAYNLLPPSVGHPGENACLGDRRLIFASKNSCHRNAFVTEIPQQQAARIVVPYNAHRKNVDAEVREIVYRVGATAGDDRPLAMLEDQHRGLARDARNFAEHKFVRHHITEDGNRDARECLDDLPQAAGFFGDLTHLWIEV